jgi:hypothetical protein
MMNRDKEFNNILDECLERVLTMGEPVEKCLKSYPLISSDLEPLLRTALVAKEASDVKPSYNFRQRARNQFQAAIREKPEIRRKESFKLQPRWVTVAITVLTLLVVSSGTVAAANNSMPDQRLYPVKLATEAVRITLTPSTIGKAELYVKLTDKRVAEIIVMADEGKADQVEKTTEKLNSYLTKAANLQVDKEGQARQILTSDSSETAGNQPPQLAAPPAPIAAPTMPQPPTITLAPIPFPTQPSRTIGNNQEDNVGKTTVTTDANKNKEKDAPEYNSTNNKEAKLKELLSKNATSNDEALKAMLERAPESVKPALKQAINVANSGYEKALNNLN